MWWTWFGSILAATAAIDCSWLLSSSSINPEANVIPTQDFKLSYRNATQIPDPSQIFSAQQWYVLDLMAENLIRYNTQVGHYIPVLAESWQIEGQRYAFKLKSDLKFHDGSPLTAQDVVDSFARVQRLRRSTHYPIWKFLKSPPRIENGEIVFQYTGDSESLFMFLSSAEGSVWSSADTKSEDFNPRRFPGFYYRSQVEVDRAIFTANPFSIRRNQFPHAPARLTVLEAKLVDPVPALAEGKLDALLLPQTPFKPLPESITHLNRHVTMPLSFIHLIRMNSTASPFDVDFLQELWQKPDAAGLTVPSYGILAPGVEGGLRLSELKEALPHAKAGRQVSVGIFYPFFSAEFGKRLVEAGKKTGLKIELIALDADQFFASIENPQGTKFDYLLSSYLASDRFASTQVRLISGHHTLPFDFENIPTESASRLDRLREMQKYAIAQQMIIPLYYIRQMIISRPEIDLGQQPVTDFELQPWRVNENLQR